MGGPERINGQGFIEIGESGGRLSTDFTAYLNDGKPERFKLRVYSSQRGSEGLKELRDHFHRVGVPTGPLASEVGAPKKDDRNIAAYLVTRLFRNEAASHYARLGRVPTQRQIEAFCSQKAFEFWESKGWPGANDQQQFGKLKAAGLKKLKAEKLHIGRLESADSGQTACFLLYRDSQLCWPSVTVYPLWVWYSWTQQALPVQPGAVFVSVFTGTGWESLEQTLKKLDPLKPTAVTSVRLITDEKITQGQK